MSKPESIVRYEQLSEDEWKRFVKSIERQVKEITGHKCKVGIGRKYRQGKPYGWQVSARVYLPKKRKKVSNLKKVPDYFVSRLRRANGKYREVRIRSDVESMFRSTGRKTTLGVGSRARKATTGFLLRWKKTGGTRQWGFFTVSHLFDQTRFRSPSVQLSRTTRANCTLVARANLRSKLDIAVFRMLGELAEVEGQLISARLISDVNQSGLRIPRAADVMRAASRRAQGVTLRGTSAVGFRCKSERFPNGVPIEGRTLHGCVAVVQSNDLVFRKGTSGSCWTIGRVPSLMQVGGLPSSYREGLGQILALHYEWVRQELGRTAQIVTAF